MIDGAIQTPMTRLPREAAASHSRNAGVTINHDTY